MAINFGEVLDQVGGRRRDELALTSDTGSLTWAEFTARTNALARGLLARGLKAGDKVGFYLFNGADYVELLAACLKARLVHVNINFRYLSNELDYVLNDVDVSALVFDHRLADRVDQLPARSRDRILCFSNEDARENGACSSLAQLRAGQDTSALTIERAGEDFIFICTGGTTGHPKAVMWEQADLARALFREALGSESRDHSSSDLTSKLDEPKVYTAPLIASPLMHGAGLLAVLTTFSNGGHVIVTDNNGPFDADQHWRLVEEHKADALAIVGDAFAKPLLQALEQNRYNLESLRLIGSSGVMWSTPVKKKLIQHIPQVKLFDSLGSSEAMGLGASMMDKNGASQTARFTLGANCAVFDEDNNPVLPGSGKSGFLARSGPMPRGYYNDPDKTARTFRKIGGERYCFPGDMCTVDA
ncbi:MAG: AMP-binding protein, partial [Pseudomonadota bacterium]|nr:AMP-binding protein [Pseudomonadota bacterium]